MEIPSSLELLQEDTVYYDDMPHGHRIMYQQLYYMYITSKACTVWLCCLVIQWDVQHMQYLLFLNETHNAHYTYVYTPLSWQPRKNIISHVQAKRYRTSRLHWDRTGTKKPLASQGLLNPCPNMEGVKDNKVSVNWHFVAELIRRRKHSRQKQRTSVVVLSELVAMNATVVHFVSVD